MRGRGAARYEIFTQRLKEDWLYYFTLCMSAEKLCKKIRKG
jgi:hypothetical protein